MVPFYIKIKDKENIQPNILFLITAHHPPSQLNRTWEISFLDHKIFLCTRCLGQYLGLIIGFLLCLTVVKPIESWREIVFWYVIMPAPVVVDWLIQTITKRESINAIRFITGFLIGMTIGIYIYNIIEFNWFVIINATIIYSVYGISVMWVVKRYIDLNAFLEPFEKFLAKSNERSR